MSERSQNSPPPGLKLTDIYHVLFRHKWKIVIIWAIGLIAAAVLWFTAPVLYKSEATLLVSYVLQSKTIDPSPNNDANTATVTQNAEGIMNTELAILRSYDLALEVANLVGPQKILAKKGGGTDANAAAIVIAKGLKVEAAPKSAIILISFASTDPTIVQPVLDQVILSYKKKHIETHLLNGSLDDFLVQQADESRNQLARTEEELRQKKTQLGVTSLDESKKELSENLAQTERDIYDAKTELAGRIAVFNEMTNHLARMAPVMSDTNSSTAGTNNATSADLSATTPVPSDVQEKYRRVCNLLENLDKQLMQLESSFTPDSPLVKGVQENVARNTKIKIEMETLYPLLAGSHPSATSSSAVAQFPGDFSSADLAKETVNIKSLEARLNLQLARQADIRKQMAALNAAEGDIVELQRKRDLYEQNSQYFRSRLERAHFDELLGPGRMPNINAVQKPSPPYRDLGKLPKQLLMLLAGSGVGAVALAFVLELYFDRSFKRGVEIETRLQTPLFMSIPRKSLKGNSRKLLGNSPRLLGPGENPVADGKAKSETNGEALDVAPWQQDQELRPFFEGLRDRLIMSFELRNLVHNPKLVAVTSCGDGAGVSTVASGLAASLSETGEGNVLLVDMNNVGQGAAHYFRKGKLEVGLDEALEMEKRESAMVQENLYVVAENASNQTLPRVLHKRFSSLLPRLKASDYDYIIFDMPPVNQISPTSKLARFMDMVFMVVEAEKTDRDAVERATSILEDSKAHVGIVLNKTTNYVPKRLQHQV